MNSSERRSWREERLIQFPNLKEIKTSMLCRECHFEVIRDGMYPLYQEALDLLAQRLELNLDELAQIDAQHVWADNPAAGRARTIEYLRQTREKDSPAHHYLLDILPRLEGACVATTGQIKDLIAAHQASTRLCSFPWHMREVSTTYTFLMALGWKAVPSILEYLKEEGGGMSVLLLLMDITNEVPYHPDKTSWKGMAGYRVSDAVDGWLIWGQENAERIAERAKMV